MRDLGEHFPAFNVAIRDYGVKKSERGDFRGPKLFIGNIAHVRLAFASGCLTQAKQRGTMERSRGVLQPAGSNGRPSIRGRGPEGGSS
jgi:hypothetical protein